MENKSQLPKRRRLFESFLIIGINNAYLDFIEEDNLLMNPQIMASFPYNSNELKP